MKLNDTMHFGRLLLRCQRPLNKNLKSTDNYNAKKDCTSSPKRGDDA